MKIVIFTGSMGKGGAERVLSIVSRMYVENGHNVKIVALLEDKLSYKLAPGVKYESVARPKLSRYFNVFYWIREIQKIMKNDKPDVVISFFSKINFLVLLAKVYKKSKLLVFERHNPNDDYSNVERVLSTLLYPKANKIILQTSAAYDFMSNKVKKKSLVLMNPLDPVIPECTHEFNRIVAVGRLVPVKNHELLIRAFATIRNNLENKYTLHIYGDGELRDNLLSLIKEKSLCDSVFLEGVRDDIFEEIKGAKIFVIPSLSEGLSNALLEAMSMGFVIVGSDISGINTVINEGVNGYLFQTGSVDSLSKVLETSITNYEKSKLKGVEARRFIFEEYIKTTNHQWLALLDN